MNDYPEEAYDEDIEGDTTIIFHKSNNAVDIYHSLLIQTNSLVQQLPEDSFFDATLPLYHVPPAQHLCIDSLDSLTDKQRSNCVDAITFDTNSDAIGTINTILKGIIMRLHSVHDIPPSIERATLRMAEQLYQKPLFRFEEIRQANRRILYNLLQLERKIVWYKRIYRSTLYSLVEQGFITEADV